MLAGSLAERQHAHQRGAARELRSEQVNRDPRSD